MRALTMLLVGTALCLGAAGCGEEGQEPPAQQPVHVEGTDPDDAPRDLSERGRRPGETFCDGPNSTASSC